MAAVAVVQFAVSLDLSVMNVGLPQIGGGLGFAAGASLTWVIHAYALAFGGLLMLGGRTADLLGRRRTLLIGVAVFAVASFLGGLAAEPWHLIAARALQGVGAAAAAPAALSILTTTFPGGPERARAFGVWAGVNAAGGALGVLVGGVLTEYAGWRWVMFVNVPMAVIAVALVARIAPDRPRRRGRPDVLGALLVTAGAALLVLGIVRTEGVGWASAQTVVVLGLAVALLAAFVAVERRTSHDPLVRVELFRGRALTGANLYNLLLGAAMASSFYLLSLHLQRVQDHSPAVTGVMFLPFALGVILGSAVSVRLRRRWSARIVLVIGAVLSTLGFVWFTGIDAQGSFVGDILGPSLLTSIGFGLALAPVVSTATEGVAARDAGAASGLLNSSRQIGAALGLATVGTAAQARIGTIPTEASVAAGYAFGFGLCAVLLGGCLMIALVLLPRHRPEPDRSTDPARDTVPLATVKENP